MNVKADSTENYNADRWSGVGEEPWMNELFGLVTFGVEKPVTMGGRTW
jgi:hypothetical protein